MKLVHRRYLGRGACVLLVGALAVVAAGCGGGSKTASSTATGPNLPT